MHKERIGKAAALMKKGGLDFIALNPGPSLLYLSGLSFHLMERPVVAFFDPQAGVHIVLPELEVEKAKSSGLDARLYPYGESESNRDEALRQAASSLKLGSRTIGIEPLRMRVFELRLLEAAAPEARFSSCAPVLAELRLIKDGDEIAAMRRAVAAAEQALEASLPLLRLGMRECEAALEISFQLLRAGSDTDLPFAPIVASGPNSAVPHATPGERRFQAGDMLVIDWGARVDGYVSDITRTFALGEAPAELAKVHEIVQEANAAGRAAVRSGVSCAAVDAAAREIIAAAGYGAQFMHRTGHGIGLEAHEGPYIASHSSQTLRQGMTFTVEPGIYLPGRGGVRIEDDVVVQADGGESLSTLPRQLRTIP
jgi:Xaa-Pro dipeptidase